MHSDLSCIKCVKKKKIYMFVIVVRMLLCAKLAKYQASALALETDSVRYLGNSLTIQLVIT